MPAAPKSPQSTAPAKRAGAPKAKGAVRAKSGCYTCRIRRKKCDEQPNEQGHCSTCVRLRLECLGFGAKRPDWLRENRNVLQLRDKIKNFLASQGMIKGHSGSGTRSSDQPTILRLTLTAEESSPYHSGSSSSPPTRPQTLSSDEYVSNHNMPRHQTSNTRSPRQVGGWGHPGVDHSYRTGNGAFTVPGVQNSQRHHRHHPYRNGYYQRPNQLALLQHHLPDWTPARSSGLSPSYNWGIDDMTGMMDPSWFTENGQFNVNAPAADWWGDEGVCPPNSGAQGAHAFNLQAYMDTPWRINDVVNLLQRYQNEVITFQYLLLGGSNVIRNHIVTTIDAAEKLTCEQQAAALLSRVHFLRFARPTNQMVLQCETDVRLQLHEIENALQGTMTLRPEGAMAALHLISVILFDGGHSGSWFKYLNIAALYVKEKMRGLTRINNGIEELRKLGEKEAFIVKTSIWFDVLASVTTGDYPLLLDVVRSLFKPGQSGLMELSNAAAAASTAAVREGYNMPPHDEKISMIAPMGCENKVVWALAEISALGTWKHHAQEKGTLSIKDLVHRSAEIEKELEIKYQPMKILADFPDVISYSRYLASNIFRASALLYLHAVVSGGYPHVPQIHTAVDEVMRWIRRIPVKPTKQEEKNIHRTVIRSTVFAFYITGALTDNLKHRQVILDYLCEEGGEIIGNCKITMEILTEIWAGRRRCSPGGQCKEEVMWREKLIRHPGQESILLV
ncbi:Transcriptional regulatory protein pro-1 [Leucoagaricus sp. SymC.cos]|nr:Transcriptional regulatory protein pro-1 [Leucoagaricus sp. SymC.cos]